MNVVQFFGKVLSEKSEKPSTACNGIIRLAIKDAKFNPDDINSKDLEIVFRTSLKERLEKVGIPDAGAISKHMLLELRKNQALFVLGV